MKIGIWSILVCAAIVVRSQITLHVVSIPAEGPPDPAIYVAGNFTGWDPGNADYLLTDNGDGTYSITVDPEMGMLEFKFTRGSWESVEGNAYGGYLPNRTYDYTGEPVTLDIEILTWEDFGPGWSTAAGNVFILDDSFYMPQLDRYRRIWMYLPPDYDTDTASYKVLYMHDGQNVFDLATSFAGEWEVDETLNTMYEAGDPGCIVVAIDNGGAERLNEYSPWAMPDYGVEGVGELYIDFIVETLKPYVDAHYRTKPEREFTGIMGSSMGGLISTYAGIAHRETFGKTGAFSPSYWVSDSCYFLVDETPHDMPMRIYSIVGALEGESMTEGLTAMDNAFVANGYTAEEFKTTIFPDGTHSEWFWAREFGDAYLWLWDNATSVVQQAPLQIEVYPNPATDRLCLHIPTTENISATAVYDLYGNLVFQYPGKVECINVSDLPKGSYLLQLLAGDGVFTSCFIH